MKQFRSETLLEQLQSDVRRQMTIVERLRADDPGLLLAQPATGKWSVVQVLEHLNSYDGYYLPAIETSFSANKPARTYFSPGWLGHYFTQLMLPKENGQLKSRMKSPKNHRPSSHPDVVPVLSVFLQNQRRLLALLEEAKTKDLGAIRIPISLTKLVKLKLGDIFCFLIAHQQRHFLQIEHTLEALQGVRGKYPATPPVM
jgi:uncharacterized damage-inducible protein DinB